jgi:hypothetical protein
MRTIALFAIAFVAVPVTAQQWVFVDGPSAAGHGAVWDARRQHAVVFTTEGETWEYDGSARLHRPASFAPSARTSVGMVYDAARERTLLFGGTTQQAFGDTWLWDGCSWQMQQFAVAPSPRSSPGMAFDSVRNRIVLFGGNDSLNQRLSDTWEHDGSQWLRRTPATVPSGFISPQLAFDSARGVTVLVSTYGVANTPMAVFEWNGTNWLQRSSTTPSPQTSYNHSLAYDPLRQRTVMFGGGFSDRELWEWDGNGWQLMLGATPIGGDEAGMYFDPQRAAVVIVEAADWFHVAGTRIWSWDGVTFANALPDYSPPPRSGYTVFHDDLRNRTFLFGGIFGYPPGPLNDIWEWDGMRWAQAAPATNPPPRQDAMACFDSVTGTSLLVGGVNYTTYLADCWRWDGVNWTQLAVAAPSLRSRGALAWDGARNEAILFGGMYANAALGDTWHWDGTVWSQLSTSLAPSPRAYSAMAFDPARGRVVLFGGTNRPGVANTDLNDTWEWDGTQWQQALPAQSPPGLTNPSMIHDPVRGRMLLVGVHNLSINLLEAWEYDGSNWSLVCTAPAIHGPAEPHLVWDQQRQRAVLFDAHKVRELTAGPATVDVLGAGCGAPPPRLAARARPRTGESLFGLELVTHPNLTAVFAFGFAPGNTPLGNGCTLLLQQVAATQFVMANGNGIAVQPIPVPMIQALRGVVMYAQASALDPAVPGGLVVSPSLRMTVGD